MQSKVLLVSIDGMRPDGVTGCGHPFVPEMRRLGASTLEARTVFPSVTLPAHMSMFHSVPPERHGISTNFYMPMVRPVNGLFEQVKGAGKTAAMVYGWEPMRDVSRPGSLLRAAFVSQRSAVGGDRTLADLAMACIAEDAPDLVYLYLGDTDDCGHNTGWMSEEYLRTIHTAIGCVQRLFEAYGEEYTVLVTADHGGHDRVHGTELPEDMTIPMFFLGGPFAPGSGLSGASILDVAPTCAKLLDVPAAPEWEGKPLVP